MDPEQVRAARGILLRLCTSEGTRARLSRDELEHEVGPRAPAVLDQLLEARLLSAHRVDPDQAAGELETSTVAVELSHESLLGRWQRLRRWRDDARTDLETLEQLRVASRTWDSRGRRSPDLWRGESLSEAVRWRRRFAEPLPSLVAGFLDASLAEENRVASLRRRVVATAVTAAVLVAVLAVAAALVIARKEGLARQQMAQALLSDAWAAYGREDFFEARAKLRTALETSDMVGARALWWRLRSDPRYFVGHTTSLVYTVDFSPDGRFLAASGGQDLIRIWDLVTGRVALLRDTGPENWLLEYSPDGRLLASGQMGGTITLWDTATHRRSLVLSGHTRTATTGDFGQRGDQLVSLGEDGALRTWDLQSGRARSSLALAGSATRPDHATNAALSRAYTSMEDGSVRIWDLDSGEPLRDLVYAGGRHTVGAPSPDGSLLATGTSDGTVLVWDLQTGLVIRSFRHPSTFKSATFSPSMDRLVSTFVDGTVAVWDLGSGETVTLQRLHRDQLDEAEFSPDGALVATASFDGDVRLWQAAVLERPRPPQHDHEIVGLAFSPDGSTLATAGWDDQVLLWDVASGRSRRLGSHERAVRRVAFSPDGSLLATASNDRTAALWDVASGEQVGTFEGHDDTVWGVTFTHDGQTLVTSGYDHTVRLWNVHTGDPVAVLGPCDDYFREVALSPDGRIVAAASSGGRVHTWTLADLRPGPTLSGPQGKLYDLSFSSDGTRLASMDVAGMVWVWEMPGGRLLRRFDRGQPGDAVRFLRQSRVLAVGAEDGIIRLLDTDSGEVTEELAAAMGTVQVLATSEDGRLLAAVGTDHAVRVWDLDSGRLRHRAPVLLLEPAPLLIGDQQLSRPSPDESGAAAREADLEPHLLDLVDAVQARGRLGRSGASGSRLGLITDEEDIELWNVHTGTMTMAVSVPGAVDLGLIEHGFVSLADGSVRSWQCADSGSECTSTTLVQDDATALAVTPDETILVATADRVRRFGVGGTEIDPIAADSGVCAMAEVDLGIVLGYEDGTLEVRSAAADWRAVLVLQGQLAQPVTAILDGPESTLVVGYAEGTVRMWDLRSGADYFSTRIHGPVVHLARQDDLLYAVSQVGDHRVLDLSPFEQSYCEVLNQIWQVVPGAWVDERVVEHPPDPGHACRE